MNDKVKKIFLIIFFIAVAITVIIYFVTKDMKSTWISAAVAGMFYFLYRFSK